MRRRLQEMRDYRGDAPGAPSLKRQRSVLGEGLLSMSELEKYREHIGYDVTFVEFDMNIYFKDNSDIVKTLFHTTEDELRRQIESLKSEGLPPLLWLPSDESTKKLLLDTNIQNTDTLGKTKTYLNAVDDKPKHDDVPPDITEWTTLRGDISLVHWCSRESPTAALIKSKLVRFQGLDCHSNAFWHYPLDGETKYRIEIQLAQGTEVGYIPRFNIEEIIGKKYPSAKYYYSEVRLGPGMYEYVDNSEKTVKDDTLVQVVMRTYRYTPDGRQKKIDIHYHHPWTWTSSDASTCRGLPRRGGRATCPPDRATRRAAGRRLARRAPRGGCAPSLLAAPLRGPLRSLSIRPFERRRPRR